MMVELQGRRAPPDKVGTWLFLGDKHSDDPYTVEVNEVRLQRNHPNTPGGVWAEGLWYGPFTIAEPLPPPLERARAYLQSLKEGLSDCGWAYDLAFKALAALNEVHEIDNTAKKGPPDA